MARYRELPCVHWGETLNWRAFWVTACIMVPAAIGGITVGTVLAWLFPITGCSSITIAQSPSQCVSQPVGLLSQTWYVTDSPNGMNTGAFPVTLSDGEAEIAMVSPNPAGGWQVTVPIPQDALPPSGIGLSTIYIDGWQQLGCSAVIP